VAWRRNLRFFLVSFIPSSAKLVAPEISGRNRCLARLVIIDSSLFMAQIPPQMMIMNILYLKPLFFLCPYGPRPRSPHSTFSYYRLRDSVPIFRIPRPLLCSCPLPPGFSFPRREGPRQMISSLDVRTATATYLLFPFFHRDGPPSGVSASPSRRELSKFASLASFQRRVETRRWFQ